jgi:hypothetical protein
MDINNKNIDTVTKVANVIGDMLGGSCVAIKTLIFATLFFKATKYIHPIISFIGLVILELVWHSISKLLAKNII